MTLTARREAADTEVPAGHWRPPGWFYAVALVAIVAAAVWLVAFSPVLGVDTVSVRGAEHITSAEVRAAASVKQGTPLVRLDTSAVRRRVEALPAVATASVQVSYPSTLIITVHERVAVGYVAANGSAVLIDATGRQFRTVADPPRQLPRFDVPTAGPQSQLTAAGKAVAVVSGALSSSIRKKLTTIQATSPDAITLLLTDGRTVFWGGADRSADKAQILPTLLRQPGTQFDVSNPDLVTAH